jgi:hypothetical protein
VRQFVERLPHFAPGWKELSIALREEPSERLEAIEKGLAANPDSETQGILLVNKALILSEQGKREDAIELLGKLALDPTSTFANEHLAKSTLSMLASKEA